MAENDRMPENMWDEGMAVSYGVIGAAYTQLVEENTEGGVCPAALPLALGGIVALGDVLRELVASGQAMDLTEEYALAFLRGALRGAEGPVYEDGRLFMVARGH